MTALAPEAPSTAAMAAASSDDRMLAGDDTPAAAAAPALGNENDDDEKGNGSFQNEYSGCSISASPGEIQSIMAIDM